MQDHLAAHVPLLERAVRLGDRNVAPEGLRQMLRLDGRIGTLPNLVVDPIDARRVNADQDFIILQLRVSISSSFNWARLATRCE